MDSVPEIQVFLNDNLSYCHEFRSFMRATSVHLPGSGACWVIVKCWLQELSSYTFS